MQPFCLRLAFVRKAALLATTGMVALLAGALMPSSTETAEANGDTRTLELYHSHTGESIQATFRVNGAYDPAVLEKLNYFLRDWRNNDRTHMDPRLFDVIWEVYRTAGATQPVVIVSAYRSPETNAMLRHRSHAVAEHSQHILGRAMDTTMPGMPMERIREIGMRLQRGGVGWYPGENFVHLDVGNVRAWPRMSYDQLVRLFPDGKTVHLAADGRTLPRYQEARAEIASRGGVISDVPQYASAGPGFFGWLFGSHNEEQGEEREVEAAQSQASSKGPLRSTRTQLASLRTESASPAESTSANPAVSASRVQGVATTTPPDNNTARNPQNPSGAERIQVADLRSGTVPSESDPESVRLGAGKKWSAVVPLPPVRPVLSEKVNVAFVNAPTPPVRPAALTRVATLAPELAPIKDGKEPSRIEGKSSEANTPGPGEATPMTRAVNLPVVITQGPKDRLKVPNHVLAFAAEVPVEDLPVVAASRTPGENSNRLTSTAAARLDREKPRHQANEEASANIVHLSVLGPSFTGLRRAVRNFPGALSNKPTADHVVAFGAVASDLDAQHFSVGLATKPLSAAEGSVGEGSAQGREN